MSASKYIWHPHINQCFFNYLGTLVASSSCGDIQSSAMVSMSNVPTSWPAGGIQAEAQDPRLEYLNLEQNFGEMTLHGHKADGSNQNGTPAGARPKTTKLYHYNRSVLCYKFRNDVCGTNFRLSIPKTTHTNGPGQFESWISYGWDMVNLPFVIACTVLLMLVLQLYTIVLNWHPIA